jgi:hypothetical protein
MLSIGAHLGGDLLIIASEQQQGRKNRRLGVRGWLEQRLENRWESV